MKTHKLPNWIIKLCLFAIICGFLLGTCCSCSNNTCENEDVRFNRQIRQDLFDTKMQLLIDGFTVHGWKFDRTGRISEFKIRKVKEGGK